MALRKEYLGSRQLAGNNDGLGLIFVYLSAMISTRLAVIDNDRLLNDILEPAYFYNFLKLAAISKDGTIYGVWIGDSSTFPRPNCRHGSLHNKRHLYIRNWL